MKKLQHIWQKKGPKTFWLKDLLHCCRLPLLVVVMARDFQMSTLVQPTFPGAPRAPSMPFAAQSGRPSTLRYLPRRRSTG